MNLMNLPIHPPKPQHVLSSGQLFAILLLLRSFAFFCETAAYTSAGTAGMLLSVLLQAVLVLPLLRACRHTVPDEERTPLYWILYGGFFLLWGGLSAVRLQTVSEAVRMPFESGLTGAVLLLITCIYAASLGTRTMGRSAVPALGLLLAGLLILLLGSASHSRVSNLLTEEFTSKDSYLSAVLQAAYADFCNSGELAAAAFLLQTVPQHRKRCLYGALFSKLLFTASLSILGLAVLGRLGSLCTYPFFSLGAYAQPFEVMRTDAFYLVLFTLSGVLCLTVQLRLAAHCLQKLFPSLRYATLTAAILTLIPSVLLRTSHSEATFLCGIWILLLTTGIPLTQRRKRGTHHAHSADPSPLLQRASDSLHKRHGST